MTDRADQPGTGPISPLRQRMLEDMAMHGLRDARHVIDLRNIGLMGAVELKPRDGAPGARALGVRAP